MTVEGKPQPGSATPAAATEQIAIHVYKHSGEYVVRPAVAVAAPGVVLQFYNLTGQRIVVTFPHSEFDFKSIPIEASASGRVSVPSVGRRDIFPYSVYSHEARGYARGYSSPEIIIEK
jgi:hypothetical protein